MPSWRTAYRQEQRAASIHIPDVTDLYTKQLQLRLSQRNASDQISMLRNLAEPEQKKTLV